MISIGFSTYSQSTSIGKIYAKPGDTVALPVVASHFKNVGALGLYIKYDENVLEYLGVNNIHDNLNNMLYNNSESIFRSGWYSANAITPLNVDNLELFELTFIYKGGNTILSFDTAVSIVADINGKNITNDGTYNNGYVYALTATGINDATNSSFYNLYPNPTTGLLNMSLNDDRNIKTVKMFNVDGKEILHLNKVKNPNVSIDISSQPAGVYFLRVESEKETSYKKVIKE